MYVPTTGDQMNRNRFIFQLVFAAGLAGLFIYGGPKISEAQENEQPQPESINSSGGTGFTYQGRLTDGGSSYGLYGESASNAGSSLPITVYYAAPTESGLANCSSWSNACTLQDALDNADELDEIWVKQGIHLPGSFPLATFSLVDGVRVYGGFNGTETRRSQRDWLSNVTILSGDIDGDDIVDASGIISNTDNITGTNSYHVVSSIGVSSSSILDGFTITAGLASSRDGAGLYNTGSPLLRNLVFSGNKADENGGGIYNLNNSTPTLENVTLTSNSAGINGGGIYNAMEANPTLTRVTIHNNHAGENGGGIFNGKLSSPSLTDVVISDNQAILSGGGMYNISDSNPTLTDVVVSGNRAEFDGGGIFNGTDCNPTLTRVQIYRNYIVGYGGGLYNDEDSDPTLTDVIIAGNFTEWRGGGIYNRSSSNPTLINVLIYGNRALNVGGGICNCNNCIMSLTNVTIAGNWADIDGGGIYNFSDDPVIQNSIIWNNKDRTGTGTKTSSIYNAYDTLPIIRFSDVHGCSGSGSWKTDCGTDGGGNIDANPLFAFPVNPSSAPITLGDYHLQLYSPAIDSGNNSLVPAGITTDLDGFMRFFDIPSIPDTGSGSPPIVDMGAYEFIIRLFVPLIIR
jgi:hypothetical protein